MRVSLSAFLVVVAVWLSGCGGSGGGPSGGGSGGGSGQSSINVVAAFAPATRIVPGYADSLRVLVTPPTGIELPPGVPGEFTLTRDSTTRLLQGLAPNGAPYFFTIEALTDGAVVGRAQRSVFLSPGEQEEVDASAFLQSEIADIAIEGPSVVSTLQSSVQYTAHARNALGQTLFIGAGFEWTSSSGRDLFVDGDTGFAIPRFPGQATVRATLKGTSLSDSLLVTIESGAVVSVSPSIATVQAGQHATFTAEVTGIPSSAVTWTVDEAAGGTVSPGGVYKAPGLLGTYHVRATSVDDPSASGVATVTVRNDAGWRAYILHPVGANNSEAYAFWQGKVVGVVQVPGTSRAAVWQGTTSAWDDFAPTSGYALIRGADGDQLVGTTSAFHATLWTGSTGVAVNLTPSWALSSEAYGVSAGRQVGVAFNNVSGHASLWSGTAASWVDLNPSFALESIAYGVHGNQQVGMATDGSGQRHAMLWTGSAASAIDLSPAGSIWSEAYAVHNGVQVGLVEFPDHEEAGMWSGSAASWVSLHPALAFHSQARGIHNGEQVGNALFKPLYHSAVFWEGSADAWTDLHVFLPSIYRSSRANAIWHSGGKTYVAGFANDAEAPLFNQRAVLWIKDN